MWIITAMWFLSGMLAAAALSRLVFRAPEYSARDVKHARVVRARKSCSETRALDARALHVVPPELDGRRSRSFHRPVSMALHSPFAAFAGVPEARGRARFRVHSAVRVRRRAWPSREEDACPPSVLRTEAERALLA